MVFVVELWTLKIVAECARCQIKNSPINHVYGAALMSGLSGLSAEFQCFIAIVSQDVLHNASVWFGQSGIELLDSLAHLGNFVLQTHIVLDDLIEHV